MFSLSASAAEKILNAQFKRMLSLFYLALSFSKMQVSFVSDRQHVLQKLPFFLRSATNVFSGELENILFLN